MKRSRRPNEAIVEPSGGGPQYRGRAGQTRTERVHLVEEDGSLGAYEIHRVVNVTTHPSLKPIVLAGDLHRLPDGRELAIPFVYHDAMERKFALVIPPALAHTEMKEWSALMQEVTSDTSVPVPSYVRDSITVLGIGALEVYLEAAVEPEESELQQVQASAPPAAVTARETELAARQDELAEREEEAQAREQQAHALEEAVKAREEEAEARAEAAKAREAEAKARAAEAQAHEEAARAREEEAKAREESLGKRDRELQAKLEQLQQRDRELAAKLEQLEQRDAELKAQRAELQERNRELDDGERHAQEVRGERAKLAEQQKALAERDAKLERAHKEMQQRQAQVEGDAKALEARDAELVRERKAAAERDAELKKQQMALEARDAELVRERKAAAARDAELKKQQKALEARDAELRKREAALAHQAQQADKAARAARAQQPQRASRREPTQQHAVPPPAGQWNEARATEENLDDEPTRLHDMSAYQTVSGKDVDEIIEVSDADLRAVEGADDLPDLLKSPSRTKERKRLSEQGAGPAATAARAAEVRESRSRERAALGSGRARNAAPPATAGSVPPPPSDFGALPAGRMVLDTSGKDLWAFVPLRAADRHAFQQGADLLCQLASVDGQPVALLTLVDGSGHAARVAFDPASKDGLALLTRLERSFRLKAAIYVDGLARDVVAVSALRESAVRAVRERVEQVAAGPASAAQLEAILQSPPPHHDDAMPFVTTRPQTASTSRVLSAVQALEVWSAPEKLDEALLLYSVPKHVVEAASRRILRAAQSFGIALSPGLAQQAVHLGVVGDRARLTADQLQSFRQRIERGDNDLDPAATLQNWGRLFAQAEQLQLEVEPHFRELADRAALDAGVQPLPSMPPDAPRQLQTDLQDADRRMAAIAELCERGHAAAIGPICDVLDALRVEEVALAVVHLLSFREHATDGLIAGLGSRSQFVRHACALGLGQLGVARALPPLLRQLQSEPTPSWSELARALGDFGPAALPAIVDALQVADRPERLMVGLAHVANHGGGVDVENLENSENPAVASAARQALARRERMAAEDEAVRNDGALRDNSPEARFSQGFYSAAAERAA